MPPDPIIGQLTSRPTLEPRCQLYGPPEDKPKKNPENKITATMNTTPAMMPTHAAA
ncbi:hypothetical protein BN1232_06419 [Mycobacterium lentiflavum]|uniref:Uncharacterized protein n=1 Tax=Mycobacterium lentiflavum TaxID=141349 RepID=A0A0E3WEG2_MYCLN|nr:hypothetical protein BN1232_06419 [Mycobacterium lentiflavum]